MKSKSRSYARKLAGGTVLQRRIRQWESMPENQKAATKRPGSNKK